MKVEHCLIVSGMKNAILYLYADTPFQAVVIKHKITALDACITIIHPPETPPNKAIQAEART
jgi:hypothetical protein